MRCERVWCEVTTAQLVNRILDKLRTGRVVFDHIDSSGDVVILYGGYTYEIDALGDGIRVRKPPAWDRGFTNDSYTRWLEGVLNGKFRNDAGEFTEVQIHREDSGNTTKQFGHWDVKVGTE